VDLRGDFLVIGSGIAGLRAAISLAEAGEVVILTKADPRESNTGYAQGGIAAALGPDDSPELHAKDTLAAGDGLCLPEAVNVLVTDLIETTGENVRQSGVATVDDVRAAGRLLAGLSPSIHDHNRALKTYLRKHLYEHHRIERMKDKASRVLKALCERYLENPRLLPDDARRRAEAEGNHRAITDYVAGMTDRYASEEYQRLFDPTVRV